MTRPLVTGNGQMLICFDENLVLRDLYYPHVGQPNHVVGRRNQVGIWVDGVFAWIGEEPWAYRLAYGENSLVIDSAATHAELGVEVRLICAVHHRENLFLQRICLHNRLDQRRQIQLFATFDFDLDGTDVGDTVLWDPTLEVLYHYKRNRCFLIGAEGPEGGIAQYATGRKRFMGAEGTWRDAEDGRLEGHPISQGAVDSTMGLGLDLAPKGSADLYVWVICAGDFAEAERGHRMVQQTGPAQMLQEIDRYWQGWSHHHREGLDVLPPDLLQAYRRSLLVIRTQVDRDGAILAANDSDILAYNRDHYSYMWPRDGAFVAVALDRAGYESMTRRFYRFCQRVLHGKGFFWHKYHPDGTVGSSWHPWMGVKGPQLPIQEDETALVLWAVGQHYRITRNLEFISSIYPALVRPAADFLTTYRDAQSGLPLESYDLWEERRGIFTFTVAAVIAGLQEAAGMADAVGDAGGAKRYAEVAAAIKGALLQHMWSERYQRFVRGIYLRGNGELVHDETLESSLAGLFLLGVLPVSDPRMVATMQALERGLWVKTEVGGLARYDHDYYFRVGTDPAVTPGNPWVICTLWLARWYIAHAREVDDLQRPLRLVRWALRHALPTGVLPEQVHPFSGTPLSVAPLTWSHSTLVETLLDLAERMQEMAAQGGEFHREDYCI